MSKPRKPVIIIGSTAIERLNALADLAVKSAPDVAEALFAELDRAKIVDDAKVPDGVVQMGSTVEFQSDTAQHGRITLVYPGEADIDAHKISILTPIGAALIGLSAGQPISFHSRDGKEHHLTVTSVTAPEKH